MTPSTENGSQMLPEAAGVTDMSLVERVAKVCEEAWLARGYEQGDPWSYLATAALEASRIDELLEVLDIGTRFLSACQSAWACGEPHHRVAAMMDLADEFQDALAKHTGEQS